MADQISGNIHDLRTCPYNPAHKVGSSKFALHLAKCRKQHPEIADKIVICEHNQSHHVLETDMSHHLVLCREYLDHQLNNEQNNKPLPPFQAEADADSAKSPSTSTTTSIKVKKSHKK